MDIVSELMSSDDEVDVMLLAEFLHDSLAERK